MPGPTPPRSLPFSSTPSSHLPPAQPAWMGTVGAKALGPGGGGPGGVSASPWVREECPGAQRRLLNSSPRSEMAATPTSVKPAEGRETLPKLGKGDEGRVGALWPPPHPGALRLLGKGASIPRPVGVLPLPSPGSRKGTQHPQGTESQVSPLPGLQAQAWPSSSPHSHRRL